MKWLKPVLIFGLMFALTQQAGAAKKTAVKGKAHAKKTAKAKTKAQRQAEAGEELGTSHNFEDHGVFGEYQMPDEALAKVENEKGLTELLGVRKHFKDRLQEASEQE